MKLRSLALYAILSTGLVAFGQDELINKVKDQGSDGTGGYHFETLIDLEATPVKNQGRSATCWSYATTSFVESEMIRMGKEPVDLSEMFTVRMVYLDKAEKYVRLHGHLNFAQGGALPDVMYVLRKYGAVPESVYDGLEYGSDINNHGELESVLKAQLDQIIRNPNKKLTPSWKKAIEATLDAYLGEYPDEFEYEGKTYTPRSFADEVVGIDPDDYYQFTSFTHQPMYEEIMIQVPDNWAWGTSYNVSLDELEEIADNSLEQGYTVGWATDVSEPGFSLKNALAIVPARDMDDMSTSEREQVFESPQPQLVVDSQVRQAAYDSYATTDDHGMQITGLVKDQKGNKYYLVKNSWGERENDFRTGYINTSKAFFRYKTISILVHREVVPKAILKKLEI